MNGNTMRRRARLFSEHHVLLALLAIGLLAGACWWGKGRGIKSRVGKAVGISGKDGRLIEADLFIEGGDRFRRRGLAKDRLGEAAGQHQDGDEDNQRDDEQRDQAEAQPLEHDFEDCVHLM